MVSNVSVGDIVDWNCNSNSAQCVTFGDSGGGGFVVANNTTFQATIQAGVFGNGSTTPGFFAVATSTPNMRNWLDRSLHTAGANIFNEAVSTGGIGTSSRGTDRLDAFWVDTSGNLKWKPFATGWGATTSLGKPPGVALSGRPAAVSWNSDRIDVFVRATNNTLWQRFFAGGSWVTGWFQMQGITATSSPAVSSWGPNRLDLFVKGADNAAWHTWFDNAWGFWESLGGTLTSDPTAVSWGFGRIDVFARGAGNQVYHKWFDGSWQPSLQGAWNNMGGNITHAPGVTSWGPGRLDIYARGPDGTMKHRWFHNKWLESWIDTGITHPGCGTSAVSMGPGTAHVFTCNAGSIWQSFFPVP